MFWALYFHDVFFFFCEAESETDEEGKMFNSSSVCSITSPIVGFHRIYGWIYDFLD